jgi:hypothetical protein
MCETILVVLARTASACYGEVMMRRPHRLPRRRVAPRSALLRLCALLVALLALGAQQRVVRAVHWVPLAATQVVSERSEKVESNALRVESPERVAPAPRSGRVPVDTSLATALRACQAHATSTRAVGVRRAQRTTHFHAKRRIPRMNSEEPPRA